MQTIESRPRRGPGRLPLPLEDRKQILHSNLEPGQLQRVREEAARREVSISTIVREAVDVWARSL
jgi:hypothetical protein